MVEEKKPTKIRAVQETVYSIHFRLTIFAALIFFFPRPKELGKLRSPVEQQTTGWLAAQRSLEGPPERVKDAAWPRQTVAMATAFARRSLCLVSTAQ